MIKIKIAYPGDPYYKKVVVFAKSVYKKKYNTHIDPEPNFFVYAKENRQLVGCFGLYRATEKKTLLFETYVSNAYMCISGGTQNRELLAELGTKTVKLQNKVTFKKSFDISILMTVHLIKEAHRIGVRYVGFTTNNSAKRITDILGFKLIRLGPVDLSKKDTDFLANWKEYFKIQQYCFGFTIDSVTHLDKLVERMSEYTLTH